MKELSKDELKETNGGSITLIVGGLVGVVVGVIAGVEVADHYLE